MIDIKSAIAKVIPDDEIKNFSADLDSVTKNLGDDLEFKFKEVESQLKFGLGKLGILLTDSFNL